MIRGLVLVLAIGCNAWPTEPPRYFSISDEFPPEQADTIRAAVGAWCDKTGHCPVEALWSERGRFELVDSLDEPCPVEGADCSVPALNDSNVVWVAQQRREPDNLNHLYTIAAHEWGHFCADHTTGGLMADMFQLRDALEVDDEAVAAWRSGCPGF